MPADAETLFAEHRDHIYQYLCRASGHAETARDLTQDVFVRVTRSTIPAASRTELKAWLFRIARNLLIDHQRQQHRRPESTLDSVNPARDSSQEIGAAINEALAQLPQVDRDVFLMREVAGLTYEEIATTCDLSVSAVRNRLHRTRLTLRDLLVAPIATTRTLPLRLFDRRHS